MKDYLKDTEFLKQLDYHKEKQQYIRITSLSNDDYPREEIVGRATGGSVNVDGASAVRRSCSLSLLALENDPIVTDDYWCYDNKFKLEIGLHNSINKEYPEIIWFNMGIYIITSFSINRSTTGFNISISGKELKMCRLNGEVSGNIMMSTDFGNIEETVKTETGEYHTTISKLPIYTIIQNALKEYGQERAENIIINDLDQYGYELWEYRGDQPMYLFIDIDEFNNLSVVNMTFNGDTQVRWEREDEIIDETLKNFTGKFYSMNTLDVDYNLNATRIILGNNNYYYVAKIEYGETAGYHRIDLVYNNDLVLNAGESVTSLLDKLKNMLGDFEYFYDLNGRFVFQKKNVYIQELFSPVDGDLITPTMYVTQYSYKFEDNQLFTAISSTPNLNNLKNDFAIWGTRKSASGDDIPIHARYALDKKPFKYVLPYDRYTKDNSLWYANFSIKDNINTQELFDNNKSNLYEYKIDGYVAADNFNSETTYYTMLKDKNYFIDSEIYSYQNDKYKLIDNQITWFYKTDNGEYLKINNDSKLPFYYINDNEYADYSYSSSEYDWRELIYQMALDFYKFNQNSNFLIDLAAKNPWFIDGKTGYEQYYSDIQAFWRQLYNPLITDNDKQIAELGKYEYYEDGDDKYWNKQIHIDPNTLNFWFDFLDTEGEFGKYSVKQYDKNNDMYITRIGTRSKVVNETSVKSIYFRETPEVLFIVLPKEKYDDDDKMAYMPIWIQDSMQNLFYRSAQGASAVAKANELIYQHVGLVEGISLTTIPIYYLQPNTRIYVEGYGDYTLDKISYSLNYNGTMNLSGNKILKQFY